MRRRITAVQARKKLGELLEGVFYRGDEVIIERAGRPMAVVIPAERYDALERSRDEMMALLERNWEKNKDIRYVEVEKAAADAVRSVRTKARQRKTA